jgi:hypothetical protein
MWDAPNLIGRGRGPRRAAGLAVITGCLLSGCSKPEVLAPVRSNEPVPTPRLSSVLSVPIDVDSNVIRRAVDAALPKQLWTIDQHSDRCVKPKQVKLFGKKLKVTPPISCTIRGVVTRGPIRLRGVGQDIFVDVPIEAKIGAYDVGGILKGETATGTALAHAVIRLSLNDNWSPTGSVRLDYDWVDAPGIDFLGQRITFAEKADTRLGPIIAELERTLPRELAKMNVRAQVGKLWAQGFTSIMLNRDKPPVWMRLTPQKLHYGGYEMHGQKLRLNLGLDALTETFVGARPDDPKVTPLPALERSVAASRLRFHIPVVADYAELQPVILRALQKRSRRPFTLPGVGDVAVRFDKIVAYGTTGEKIAVGITLGMKPESMTLGETRGVIWLVARPVNAPNSAKVAFTDLAIAGDTDGVGGDLLVQLAQSGAFSQIIASSLTQNFSNDLDKLMGKIRHAIKSKQTGQFLIGAKMDRIATGRLVAYGQGLYLPVDVEGTASVTFKP